MTQRQYNGMLFTLYTQFSLDPESAKETLFRMMNAEFQEKAREMDAKLPEIRQSIRDNIAQSLSEN